MKNLQKITALLLMAVMVATMLVVPGGNVQAAKKKKVQLNKKKVTLEVGKKVTLKLKNAPKKKKITWRSNKKKIASVSKKGVVTAKKAGKAEITAKVKGKKYVCKVTVKKKSKTKNTRNAADVAALQKMIKDLNAKGAQVPTDINQEWKYDADEHYYEALGYRWNKDGRLESIVWNNCYIQGTVNLQEFPALKFSSVMEIR